MRGLKAAVIVMGVMIVAGVAVLGFAIVQRLGSLGGAGPAVPVVLDEPAGTRIVAASALPDRVALTLQGGGPDRVVVVDQRTGRVVARVGLAR